MPESNDTNLKGGRAAYSTRAVFSLSVIENRNQFAARSIRA
jgi:hypothetical protein